MFQGFEVLSPREREVVELVASGLGNKQIALKLGISPSTAKGYVQSALCKTNASNRAELAARWVRWNTA